MGQRCGQRGSHRVDRTAGFGFTRGGRGSWLWSWRNRSRRYSHWQNSVVLPHPSVHLSSHDKTGRTKPSTRRTSPAHAIYNSSVAELQPYKKQTVQSDGETKSASFLNSGGGNQKAKGIHPYHDHHKAISRPNLDPRLPFLF